MGKELINNVLFRQDDPLVWAMSSDNSEQSILSDNHGKASKVLKFLPLISMRIFEILILKCFSVIFQQHFDAKSLKNI